MCLFVSCIFHSAGFSVHVFRTSKTVADPGRVLCPVSKACAFQVVFNPGHHLIQSKAPFFYASLHLLLLFVITSFFNLIFTKKEILSALILLISNWTT